MKIIILICLGLVYLTSADLNDYQKSKFGEFKAQYAKKYKDNQDERKRQINFAKNLDIIEKHNAKFKKGLSSFQLGVNQYSDLSAEEFAKQFLGAINIPLADKNGSQIVNSQRQALPTSVDWRSRSAVTPVKNQGQCGSCWAFATTGPIETQLFKKTGVLTSLSEQQLVDCNYYDQFLGRFGGLNYYGNMGCNGGYINLGFQHLSQYGVMKSSDYPNTAFRQSCKYNRAKVVARISSPIAVSGESAIQERLANFGPINVMIQVSSLFQNYKSGIFEQSDCVSRTIGGHAIVPVGYGSAVVNGVTKPFWIIKNSWGSSWGEGGYIRILRNARTCGFGSYLSYYSNVL